MNLLGLFALSFLTFLSLTPHVQAQQKLRVATAANLKYPIEELIIQFEKEENFEIELITASSGVLYNQIINSAPYDIYLSANEIYPLKLVEKEFCSEVLNFAKGQLVFWSKNPVNEGEIPALIEKLNPRTVAIAHETLSPFGASAITWLNENMPGNFDSKLVIGENVGQVNRYIYSGAIDGAFTSNSAMFSMQISSLGNWTIIENSEPIDQTACVLLKNTDESVADIFIKFLLSDKGQSTLSKFGYLSGDARIK